MTELFGALTGLELASQYPRLQAHTRLDLWLQGIPHLHRHLLHSYASNSLYT